MLYSSYILCWERVAICLWILCILLNSYLLNWTLFYSLDFHLLANVWWTPILCFKNTNNEFRGIAAINLGHALIIISTILFILHPLIMPAIVFYFIFKNFILNNEKSEHFFSKILEIGITLL